MRSHRGCPHCGLLPPNLAIPRGMPEVRLVPVWVGWGAPGRGA